MGGQIPLLVGRVYGLFGYLRLAVPEHTVIESHPDDALHDLRLLHPFPALASFAKSVDLEVRTPCLPYSLSCQLDMS